MSDQDLAPYDESKLPEKIRRELAEFDRWAAWPAWAKDAVVTDVDVRLSWWDAVKLLIFRRFTVTTKVFTERVVGQISSLSRFSAPRWPWAKPVGYVVADPDAENTKPA